MKQELNFRIQDHNIAILFVQQATLRTLPRYTQTSNMEFRQVLFRNIIF